MGKTRKISEARLTKAHDKAGSRRYGKRWESANFGWCVDSGSIASKVYGDPALVFTSYIKAGRIKHREERY